MIADVEPEEREAEGRRVPRHRRAAGAGGVDRPTLVRRGSTGGARLRAAARA